MTQPRTAEMKRKTRETDITAVLNLDGNGIAKINTGIPFFDHMMELFAKHGKFDLTLKVKGDLDVDSHHTMEDTGLVLGELIRKAVGDKSGITRYGSFLLPMDEVLAMIALDLSGRPFLVYNVEPPRERIGNTDTALFGEFFRALSNTAAMNLHIRIVAPGEVHHTFEAIFKGFGRALRNAVSIDPREKGIPSTKGTL